MVTAKEEYEYYMNQYEQSLELGKHDADYLIVAEKFKSQADSWKRKIPMTTNITKLEQLLKTETHNKIISAMPQKGYVKIDGDKFTIFVPKTKKLDKLPCIVSHTDTVSQNKPKTLLISNKRVMTNPDGVLGADDRAGCYIMYEMMKQNTNAMFIFTDEEEIGGVGAGNCAKSVELGILSEHISCFIELDRRGSSDCATYGVDNQAMIDLMAEFGYHDAWGSYTDIVDLCEETGIAGVNLSVGYYNEHTKTERLHLNELEKTLDFMLDLPQELYGTTYEIEAIINSRYVEEEELVCDCCGEHERLWFVNNIQLCEMCKDYGTEDSWYEQEGTI